MRVKHFFIPVFLGILMVMSFTIIHYIKSDILYSRTLEGEVVNVGSRIKMRGETAQQKVSLLIKADPATIDPKINETACGPSGCTVECLSTRCAGLMKGTCHRLKCRYSHRFFEPDIIGCKHDKEIVCDE